ncbi:MAG: zinc-ribbon domain-containing protein [Candidatus Heimdallarchaeaceae archaeon]
MSMERKRYRFGSFSWFLLIVALIGVYYIFIDDLTVFFIAAGISICAVGVLWFLARRGVVSKTNTMSDRLNKYHGDVQEKYKSDQRIISLKDKNENVKFCEHCGHRIDNDSSFCSNCGKEM